MRRVLVAALIWAAAALAAAPVHAVEPDEILADAALEARARAISKELRCLVCQNQSIDDSSADLARDLRLLVRRRLTAGDNDAQVIAYVSARYGDFVLLRPPVKPVTYLLWFGPAAILVIGVAAMVVFFRRRAGSGAAPPLTDEERRRLAGLLDGKPEP